MRFSQQNLAMDDAKQRAKDSQGPSKETKSPGEGLDLSSLSGLDFGPDWSTSSRTSTKDYSNFEERSRERRGGGRKGGDRDGGRGRGGPRGGGGGDRRRDDRGGGRDGQRFGGGGDGGQRGQGQGAGQGHGRGDDRQSPSGGPRGRGRGERDGRGDFRNRPAPFQPTIKVDLYPEDAPFAALTKVIKATGKTYELFEIAQLLLEKPERMMAVLEPLPEADGGTGKLFVTVRDGLPFDTEESALNHIAKEQLEEYFDTEEVEVDPPKGNFVVVNKCTISGELIGPPNYHRYQQFLQDTHARVAPHLPFEVYQRKVESLKDEEQVQAWLEKMQKQTRYIWKADPVAPPKPSKDGDASEAAAKADPPADEEPKAASEAEAPADEPDAATGDQTEDVAASEPAEPAAEAKPEVDPSLVFETAEAARRFLVDRKKEAILKDVPQLRFPCSKLDSLPRGSMTRRSIEARIEQQRRFPLDTANNLRGRLRRQNFTIYKKGSKGISYLCANRRKFREPGQVFGESIQDLLEYIEKYPLVKASELPEYYLGIEPEVLAAAGQTTEQLASKEPAKSNALASDARGVAAEGGTLDDDGKDGATPLPKPEDGTGQPTGEPTEKAAEPESPVEAKPEPEAETESTPESDAKPAPKPIDDPRLRALRANLRWLVTEGYVIEYGDGRLFANPVIEQPKKKKNGEDEDDRADLPEAAKLEKRQAAEEPDPAEALVGDATTAAGAATGKPAEGDEAAEEPETMAADVSVPSGAEEQAAAEVKAEPGDDAPISRPTAEDNPQPEEAKDATSDDDQKSTEPQP